MKKVEITPSDLSPDSSIKISGSKSESNRVLILNSIFKNIKISNLSDSDDSVVLKYALENLNKNIDIHHAGKSLSKDTIGILHTDSMLLKVLPNHYDFGQILDKRALTLGKGWKTTPPNVLNSRIPVLQKNQREVRHPDVSGRYHVLR